MTGKVKLKDMTKEELGLYRRLHYYHKQYKTKTSRRFTKFLPEEIRYIGEHSGTTSSTELAKYFGCSPSSICYQIRKNNFPRFKRR